MKVPALVGHYTLKLCTSLFLQLCLLLCNVCLALPVKHLLSKLELVVLKLHKVPLHVLTVEFIVVASLSLALHVIEHLVALVLGITECLIRQVQLMRQMIDVSLQGVNLLYALLLTLLRLAQTKLGPVDFLL